MSVVQRALQPALQPPMHPPLQSQLHSQLEMQSYSHLCLAQLCNLLETEIRCLPSSQLGSQLRTRPRAHDRCLLTYPAIFNLFFQNSCRPRKTSFRSATKVRWTSVPNALEQRSAAATVSRRIAFFIKDSESSATRRDLFDNFLNCIRSPLHVSRLHKYVQLPTCSTQARRLHKTGLQPSCGSTELLPARAYLCSR